VKADFTEMAMKAYPFFGVRKRIVVKGRSSKLAIEQGLLSMERRGQIKEMDRKISEGEGGL
jgi:hypothetical protein